MTNKPENNVHAASAELSIINYLNTYFGVGRWTKREDGSFSLEISNHPMHNQNRVSPYSLLSSKLLGLDVGFKLEASSSSDHMPFQKNHQTLSFSEENAQKMRKALEERKLSISDIIVSTYPDSGYPLQR